MCVVELLLMFSRSNRISGCSTEFPLWSWPTTQIERALKGRRGWLTERALCLAWVERCGMARAVGAAAAVAVCTAFEFQIPIQSQQSVATVRRQRKFTCCTRQMWLMVLCEPHYVCPVMRRSSSWVRIRMLARIALLYCLFHLLAFLYLSVCPVRL